MMSSNTLPLSLIVPTQSLPKIPFENSKTMDDCRIQVLRKFRKEIVETVKFSDVSPTLIECALISKEECFEICKLRVRQQMTTCFQKVHDIMDILVYQKHAHNDGPKFQMEDKPNFALVKEIWNNFITALRMEHNGLATKMENELDKCAENKLLLKRVNSNSKLKKTDIGPPQHFHHVQHFQHVEHLGIISGTRMETPTSHVHTLPTSQISTKRIPTRANSDGGVTLQQRQEIDENDADLREFFKRAGVVERHLTNPITRQIIFRFITENGGMNAIRNEVQPKSTSTPTSPINNDKEHIMKSTTTTTLAPTSSPPVTSLPQRSYSPPPATVPFVPTPKPTPVSFYF